METMTSVGLALLEWPITASALILLGGYIYGQAAYDAWGESNVDKRVFWSGFLAGIGVVWLFLAPYHIFGAK